MNPGSAIPAWLYQIAPRWLIARPDFFEAAYAFTVSALMGAGTVLYTIWVSWSALAPQADQTFAAYVAFVGKVWFSFAAPIIWGTLRGRNAQQKAAQAPVLKGL